MANGGIIGPVNTPTISSASGVWTLVDQQLAKAQGIWPPTTDPYFEYTTLLLPGNGTNGAQNNTFLDGSTNNFPITRNGNTTQGTFSPFSQTGWGNYFGTSGHALGVSNGLIQTTDTTFTMECWIYMLSNPTGGNPNTFPVLIGQMDQTAGTIRLALGPDGNGKLNFYWYDGGNKNVISTTTIQLNTWTHIAVSVNSNAITIYINGTSSGTGTLTNRNSLQNNFYVGNHYTSVYNYIGYVSQVRVVSGVAVYTGNFTPPELPLSATQSSGTNISAITTGQTKLLTCQSNRFVDNGQGNTSNTPFTITVAGSPTVVAFSPFNPSASWSAATYGGSGYFDGSGDYLTATNSSSYDFGSGDFTIEAFAYPTTASQLAFCARGETTGFSGFILSTTNFLATTNGSSWDISITFTTALTANAWNHVALVRNGNVYTAYLNGAANGTTTVSGTIVAGTAALVIGRRSGQTDYSGYVSNFRIVKGTAVYTAAFTPPTAPLTAITNTSLLLNFTNAGIYDATSKNDLETVGNAQISTTQSKWGGSSMAFDGNADWLSGYNDGALLYLGTTYTIEFWLRLNSVSGTQNLIVLSASNVSNQGINCYTSGTSITVDDGNTASTGPSGGTLAINTWYHVALVANGTNTKLFIDGNTISTYAGITRYTAGGAWKYITVGVNGSKTSNYLNGYINDLRITNGVARYTANFTLLSPFPTL